MYHSVAGIVKQLNRYHGHSMSDPGTTYRNRDEIASMRTARDPIEFVKNLLVDHGLAEAQELKEIEKDIRKEVQVRNMPMSTWKTMTCTNANSKSDDFYLM